MNLSAYYPEFLSLALAHFLAVASPGPDFAIVMKHSISYGKRVALVTSVGIGMAIFIHVAYSLLGIGLIIHSTAWLYDLLIILAAGFLFYIGFGAIRASASTAPSTVNKANNDMSNKKAFYLGFLTNGLNPKATLFFLSLFTVLVKAETPMLIKGLYGVYLALATMVWFCFLSLVLSKDKVRRLFQRQGHWFDRVMGLVLILLAARILYVEIIAPVL